MGDALHALADQAAAFAGLLLLASALHKAVRWSHLQNVVRIFVGVRASLSRALLAMVAVMEAVGGGLLFVATLRSAAALLAAMIWAVYLLLITRAIAQGRRDADCGCSFGATQRPLGTYQLGRNAVLVALALGVALDGVHAGGGVHGSQILAGCALLALYGALDQVMGLQPLRGGELL